MSAICRKDYHTGKGGDLILKVIAHPFWKEETMHMEYWLGSSRLRPECSQEQVATWGNASVRARLSRRNGGGAEAAGKEDSCYLNVSGSAGKLRTMHLHSTATNPLLSTQ